MTSSPSQFAKKSLWVAATGVLLCLGLSFRQAGKLMHEHDHIHRQKDPVPHQQQLQKIGITRLPNEDLFEGTLKSCVPGQEDDGGGGKKQKEEKCGTFVPEGSKERIGILAPPGDIADSVVWLLKKVVATGTKQVEESDGVGGGKWKPAKEIIEIISTTHMAPYGYGKTHGWTRLARIIPQPLLVGATDTLRAANGGDATDLTFQDLKASLRQQIRYHCRLNHISAHTALWTVGLEELSTFETDDLEELVDWVQGYLDLAQPEEIKDDTISLRNFDSVSKVDNMYDQGAAMLSLLQTKLASQSLSKNVPAMDLLKELDIVLLDELKISKNLTAWPCQSFWTVGEPTSRLDISPVIRRIAQAMSPNCTASFTSCFVKQDKCEFSGDGKCS